MAEAGLSSSIQLLALSYRCSATSTAGQPTGRMCELGSTQGVLV